MNITTIKNLITLFALLLTAPGMQQKTVGDEGLDVTISVVVAGKEYVGRPLVWDAEQYVLLQRDGEIKTLNTASTSEFAKTSDDFQPLSDQQLALDLWDEFPGYEVTRTGKYVVVHPSGKADKWAWPFETLYDQFTQYFQVRNFSYRDSQFPLVVVVLESRNEFVQFSYQQGVRQAAQLAGYYSPTTNRVITYDHVGNGFDPSGSDRWDENMLTLVHEALHQFSFNTGIQNRWGQSPKWASEGLACIFEARGVFNSHKFTRKSDRIHLLYLQQLNGMIREGKTKGFVKQLVENDRTFQQNPTMAYSASWALMFYLSEHDPAGLSRYLNTISERPGFQKYSATDRINDFAQEFGTDFNGLEARVVRFLEKIE